MISKFLIVSPGGGPKHSGCSVLQDYLMSRRRISVLDSSFNLDDDHLKNPQNWLSEINGIYDYSVSNMKSRGCVLKANAQTIRNWIELRRMISLAVPDLRIIFITRNHIEQCSSAIAQYTGKDELPISIDVDHLAKIHSLFDSANVKLHHVFQLHSHLDISYEDLINSPRRTMNLVFEFLGLGADKEFKAANIQPDPTVAEVIGNLDEVRKVKELACLINES